MRGGEPLDYAKPVPPTPVFGSRAEPFAFGFAVVSVWLPPLGWVIGIPSGMVFVLSSYVTVVLSMALLVLDQRAAARLTMMRRVTWGLVITSLAMCFVTCLSPLLYFWRYGFGD